MAKKIHILGVCGTLMAGIARLATELGLKVSGSDKMLAPPMSDQLQSLGITLDQNMQSPPEDMDTLLIGNVLTRGQPIVEQILQKRLNYDSAPNWLYQNILHSRPVIAISGTHGKTTTTSMVAWILEQTGHSPGFLIGGIAENFGVSSRLGNSQSWFVIEADEYDTAFFDKRPKFLHYQPQILLINNLEFDHADVYTDLSAIQKQFHFLLRQLPSDAKIIYPQQDNAIQTVIQQGCWSEQITLNDDWQLQNYGNGKITILHQQKIIAEGLIPLIGEHNRNNILAAIAVCHQAGISAQKSLTALQNFKGVKRRLEIKKIWQKDNGIIRLIDDFAHHPTAIQLTLQALTHEKLPHPTTPTTDKSSHRVIALLDLTTNSMKKGSHKHLLAASLENADKAFVWQSQDVRWDVKKNLHQTPQLKEKIQVFESIEKMSQAVTQQTQAGDDLIMLSNGNFGGLSTNLLNQLNQTYPPKI
jgi:UDP-N-acetylmuramate: L-alanyl-gamma-D-glutamyl-meso-diaminopimelate ligase